MKQKQGSFILGSVKMKITGEHPAVFLNLCMQHDIIIWDVTKSDGNKFEAKVYLKDVPKIRKIRKGTSYKIKFINKYGLPFIKERMVRNKPLIAAFILSLLLLIAISNMIWQVSVTGVPKELETKIISKLNDYGVHPGAFKITINAPNQIQQQILEDIPELLWIGVQQKGTTYHLEAVEKIIIKDDPPKSPQHLIANKSGVIQSLFIRKGLPKVRINNYVQEGDLLVSGLIEGLSEDEDAMDEIVAAEGEVWAKTWYTADITIPLETHHEELTGNFSNKYKVKLGNTTIPLWPLGNNNFEQQIRETESKQLKIFNWELPIYYVTERNLETTINNVERSVEEAVEIGIEQVKKDLLQKLDTDAQILTEKVLHETIDRGKVKLSLYITVSENIAIEQQISQGD